MDLFGTDQIPVNDTIIGSTNVGIKSSSSGNDLFMVSDNSAATDDSNINLLGDFGDITISPLGNSSTQKSTSEKPSMNRTAKPSSTALTRCNFPGRGAAPAGGRPPEEVRVSRGRLRLERDGLAVDHDLVTS